MARSAAAMVSGYARFDPKLNVEGLCCSIESAARDTMLCSRMRLRPRRIWSWSDIYRPDSKAIIPDRHLGLMTAIEQSSEDLYQQGAEAAKQTINLDLIEALAGSCRELSSAPLRTPEYSRTTKEACRGRLRSRHFASIAGQFQIWNAELVRFSPLRDQALPAIDLLYLKG